MAKYKPLKEGEKGMIAQQLGRQPRKLKGVAVRCESGNPQVIVTHPVMFHGGEYPEVFPSLYWLSCPRLVKEISRLEGAGLINEIQEMIDNDQDLKDELEEAYQLYAKQRLELVKEPTLKLLREWHTDQYQVLCESGVGGIRSEGIKCLHAQLADYLVNGINPVGRIVAERLGDKLNESCNKCSTE